MPKFPELRYRQVHLDFHTSEHIEDVGAEFDEKQFIGALKKGHVNSVTVFAMCHHGWCYYDTKVGEMHPHLKTELLPRMLAACAKADIQAPVYITVGWNERMADLHPDWLRLHKDGRLQYAPPEGEPDDARPWGWRTLCLNTPYVDFICEITKEVVQKFKPVGLFYDITFDTPCYCSRCVQGMIDAGLDPEVEADAREFYRSVYINYLKRVAETVWSIAPFMRIFHNGDGNRRGRDDYYPYFSHFEIESLPTGGWGYDHYPLNAKYFLNRGLDFLGMTGKFHKCWGEFGGFKHPNALKYECAHMLSVGSKCSVGDQLHPSGKMDEETYRIIGEAYKLVEEREQYAKGLKSVADIAVVCASTTLKDSRLEAPETGACNVLLETHRQFDIVDAEHLDFAKYKLIILPDLVPVSDAFAKKLSKFVKDGGALLLSGESGLDEQGLSFNLDLGAEFAGQAVWDVDYTLVGDKISEGMVKSPFLNYSSGCETLVKDAEVLAKVVAPYFRRTYKHFCSHGVTPPSRKDAGYPAVIRKGRVIYIAHKIFTMYKEHGMRLHRDLVDNCLKLLLPEPVLEVGLPSVGRAYLGSRDGFKKELLLSLLHCAPVKRGAVEVVEDLLPVFEVPVKLRVGAKKVKAVELPLSGSKLEFKSSKGVVSFVVPKVELQEIVLVKFA